MYDAAIAMNVATANCLLSLVSRVDPIAPISVKSEAYRKTELIEWYEF